MFKGTGRNSTRRPPGGARTPPTARARGALFLPRQVGGAAVTSLPRPAPRAPPGAGFPGVPRLRLLSHPGARASPPSPPRARRLPRGSVSRAQGPRCLPRRAFSPAPAAPGAGGRGSDPFNVKIERWPRNEAPPHFLGLGLAIGGKPFGAQHVAVALACVRGLGHRRHLGPQGDRGRRAGRAGASGACWAAIMSHSCGRMFMT